MQYEHAAPRARSASPEASRPISGRASIAARRLDGSNGTSACPTASISANPIERYATSERPAFSFSSSQITQIASPDKFKPARHLLQPFRPRQHDCNQITEGVVSLRHFRSSSMMPFLREGPATKRASHVATSPSPGGRYVPAISTHLLALPKALGHIDLKWVMRRHGSFDKLANSGFYLFCIDAAVGAR